MTALDRPKMLYVDWAELETTLADRSIWASDKSTADQRRRPRMVTTVDAELVGVRRNVKDAARAVLTWLAAVTDHNSKFNLDRVLDRCLRPGPDPKRINYAALARQINLALGVDLTPKRVRTAIQHLRDSCGREVADAPQPALKQKLDTLHQHLQANYAALVDAEVTTEPTLRRTIAVEVLVAVRSAAGRLIENDFGEGIPQCLDLDYLENRFLDYVRGVVRGGAVRRENPVCDLGRLLVALCDYDQSSESDMRLVMDGAHVVEMLTGPASLPGLVARLNVLVSGRDLINSELYIGELTCLADAAADLAADAQTKTLMNWVRRLPEDQRIPSPIRISSYCLMNAATHILERLFTGELSGESWMARARTCFDRMAERDSGFRLIKTTRVIHLTVAAKLSGDPTAIEKHFADLGPTKALSVLEDLARFDNCVELVRAARAHATGVLPDLKHQLIRG